MDHQLTCSAFKPPPPLSLSTYFDQVTLGQAKPSMFMSVWVLDGVLRLIECRPNFIEQAALLSELENRFLTYGRQHRWIDPPPDRNAESSADGLTNFIVQDLLGIKGMSPQDKSLSVLKALLKKLLKEGLNSKGKTGLKVLELLLELGSAKNAEDVARAFGKLGVKELASWAVENRDWLMRHAFKGAGMTPVARNRLIKLIAARLTWFEVLLSRVAWVLPWLTAIDLFLTPERIADDEIEARLTFLTAYGRVFSTRSSQFGRLVRRCSEPEWELSSPLQQALGAAISQAQ